MSEFLAAFPQIFSSPAALLLIFMPLKIKKSAIPPEMNKKDDSSLHKD